MPTSLFVVVLRTFREWGAHSVDFVLQSMLYPIILALLGHRYVAEFLPLELKHSSVITDGSLLWIQATCKGKS